MILDDWQKEILACKGHIGLAKGRRIGATHIFAIKAVEHLVEHPNNHPESQIVCVSLTEDQAKLIISFATSYAEKKYPHLVGKKENKPQLTKLTLVIKGNKRFLTARPVGNTGDAARGFEGQVLMVDEASRMPTLFWKAAKPILATTGGKIWMWSTFDGEQGYFWENYNKVVNKKDPKGRFQFWNKSTPDVFENRKISSTWTKEIREEALQFLKDEENDMTTLEFAEEYLGIPSNNLLQFFPTDLIDACCTLERPDKVPKTKNSMGVDVARMGGDENAYQIIHDDGTGFFKHTYSETEKYKLTTETERKIKDLALKYKCKKVGIDAGAGTLGVSILDHLRETEIKNNVVPMNNREVIIEETDGHETGQRLFKQDLYFNLKSMLEHGEIKLLDDEDVKLSLKSVQMKFVETTDGNKRLKLFGDYTHIAEGLIRAAWLAKKEKTLKLWAA